MQTDTLMKALALTGSLLLAACSQSAPLQAPPQAAVTRLNSSRTLDMGYEGGSSLKGRVNFHTSQPGFGIRALNQPGFVHRTGDIRSSKVELYRCTTQAAAEAADPSGQAACTLAGTQNQNHASGIATLTFTVGNLRQSSRYSARVTVYSASGQTGTNMGSAWPDLNAGVREHINSDADATLSIVNNVGAAGQLDLTLQLGNTTAGGSVSNNTVTINNGSAVIGGTETITVP